VVRFCDKAGFCVVKGGRGFGAKGLGIYGMWGLAGHRRSCRGIWCVNRLDGCF